MEKQEGKGVWGEMIEYFSVDWHKDFGIDHRKGWSVSVNGSYFAELEKFLIVALIKAIYRYLCAEWDCRDD